MSDCNAVQFSDQMTCSCGNVWDMNDPYPPGCKTEPAMLAAAPDVQGEPVGYVSQDFLEGKQKPDVTQLVEALTELCDEIDKHEIHAAISKTSISWFKRKARAVLAAYRKQGGEV